MIERLQNQHSLVILVTTSLTTYMDKVREIAKGMIYSYVVFLWNYTQRKLNGMLMFSI